MDNNKIIPLIGIFASLFFLWNAWTTEQSEIAAQNAANTQQAAQSADTPALDASATATNATNSGNPGDVPQIEGANSSVTQNGDIKTISVKTDVYDMEISLQGGTIIKAGLIDYPAEIDQPDNPFALLKNNDPDSFELQTGLLHSEDADLAPNHRAIFQSGQDRYEMQDGERLVVPLTWQNQGVTVTKQFIFEPGQYDFIIRQEVANQSQQPWSGSYYRQFLRTPPASQGGLGTINSYVGGAISSNDEIYQKVRFSDMEDNNLDQPTTDGWVAMLQHYFLGALLPADGQNNTFYTKNPATNQYILGMTSRELVTVAPNQRTQFDSHVYVGPKIQADLEALAPSLERAVDYGFLWFIAEPLFKGLKFFHSIVGNWGWAIIMLTILIKAIFYYPTAMSYRSMAKMRLLTPKMTELRKRYSDDKAKQQQEMMKLYRKEKVNPLGGCLPMLIQIPVFISLYWMLNETVELRHAPWILWYEDLSVQDPYYILPVLNGALMFFQQKLNPPPTDPLQQKIFQWLPVFFTFIFLFFPAGLVLYWVTNSAITICQQWYINKKMEKQGLGRKQNA